MIWVSVLQGLEENMGYLVGDCLLAASFLSYMGPFLSNYREELLVIWMKEVRHTPKKHMHPDLWLIVKQKSLTSATSHSFSKPSANIWCPSKMTSRNKRLHFHSCLSNKTRLFRVSPSFLLATYFPFFRFWIHKSHAPQDSVLLFFCPNQQQ